MDGPRLAAIEKVSVKTTDCPNETETEHFLKVETVRRYNDTALVFLMANNQALFVWNGETVYVNANGTAYPVCEATATCAALYVDDNEEKEQLEEKANAALEAGGFTEATARRRLGFRCPTCWFTPQVNLIQPILQVMANLAQLLVAVTAAPSAPAPVWSISSAEYNPYCHPWGPTSPLETLDGN